MKRNRYTPEQCAWLRQNRPATRLEELAQAFNTKFNASVSHRALQTKCLQMGVQNPHRFGNGETPWNKGKKTGIVNSSAFKPGQKPHKVAPIGYVRRNSGGFLEIKTADGTHQYKKLHRDIYEKHHGPIGHDEMIVFVDGNRDNIDIGNLEKVTKRELLVLNTREDFGPHNPPEINRAIIATIRLEIAAKIRQEAA